MAPEVTASILSAVISGVVSYFMAERTARREFERDVQQVRTEFMAERVARQLLSDERWRKRSFEQIKRRLGGFEDNELRKILVRAGAIRFFGPPDRSGLEELWGLRERNPEGDKDDA